METLPEEILEFILSLIPPYADLKNCMLVNKRWNRAATNVIHHKKIDFCRAIGNFKVSWENIYPKSKPHTISKRYSHAACSWGNFMYVFGGCTCTSTTFNDLWKLDLGTREWSRILTMGSYPSPKACATMVNYKQSLILFGGWTHPSPYPLHQAWRTFNELHIYDVPTNRWRYISSPTLSPPAMAGHACTVHGDKMVVFGGLLGCGRGSNDVWCLDLLNNTWSLKETNDVKPPTRYGHSQIVVDDDHLLVFGGWGGPPNMVMTDVWLLDMRGRVWTWKQVRVDNSEWAASHLWCHPACKVNDYVVVLSRRPVSNASPMAYPKLSSGAHAMTVFNDSFFEPVRVSEAPPPLPPIDRDVNVNGKRGPLPSRESKAAPNQEGGGGWGGGGPPTLPPSGNHLFTNMSFFREEERPAHKQQRERQLGVLKKHEERLKVSQRWAPLQPSSAPARPKMAMFVLDISSVREGVVAWLPVKCLPKRSPDATILYTLVHGKGELVMFGGIRKEPPILSFDQTVTIPAVSNSLHFISAPPSVI